MKQVLFFVVAILGISLAFELKRNGCWVSSRGLLQFEYPKLRRNESIQDDYFGTIVSDPYRWLEDPESPETKQFVQEQNDITKPFLEEFVGREIIRKKLEELQNYDQFDVPSQRGNRYFFNKKEGLQNQAVHYVQDGLDGIPRILVDPNTLRADGTTSLKFEEPSNNGEILSYGLSSKGSDWTTVHFKNVTNGQVFPETLKFTKWPNVQWSKDDSGVYYSRYPDPKDEGDITDGTETTGNYNEAVYFHKLGTSQSEDILLVQFPEHPKWSISADLSDDNEYLIVNAIDGISFSQIYYVKVSSFELSGFRNKPEVTHLVGNFEAIYEFLGNTGTIFYFRTDKDAPNYRLIGVDLNSPEEKNWILLLPESQRDVLVSAHPVNGDKMVVVFTRDVKSVLQLRSLNDGSLIQDFNMPAGSISDISCLKEHTQFFFEFTSYLDPGIVFRVDLTRNSPKPEVYKQSTPEGFDSTLYETKQIFYPSRDGTRIPMFIISKKGVKLDGSSPTLLYGYGGFSISLEPTFSSARIAFLQLFDGIYAVANLRGGGEYGAKWHNAGTLLNKQNVFDDFQAAAEYLISAKYTSREKLTIQGGSNGGLLVGACVNQRPDLFGAAVSQVGVHDMLRYHKFTIGYLWASDYGTSENRTEFEYLLKYSPVHNVRVPEDPKVQYPAVLVTTGDHDDRVVPHHSYKFIAALQHIVGSSSKQTAPLMISIETDAGHGAGKPTWKKIAEVTDTYSFIARVLNLKVNQL